MFSTEEAVKQFQPTWAVTATVAASTLVLGVPQASRITRSTFIVGNITGPVW